MEVLDVRELERRRLRSRAAALAGILSGVLLVACFLWAHHWGLRADLLVASWAASTLAALGLSIWLLRTNGGGRHLAQVGLSFAVLSVLALVVAGIAFAAGGDPTGACGGG